MKILLTRLQNSWWVAWAAALLLALTHLKDAADGVDRTLLLLKIKQPDALALSEAAEKGDFSRSLTEAAWRRLFWARAYCSRIGHGAAMADVEEAYKKYIAATEVWSSKIMVYIVTTERFYGEAKGSELESDVQSAFGNMGKAIIAVRFRKSGDNKLLTDAEEKIDTANDVLYKFVRGFQENKSGKHGAKII